MYINDIHILYYLLIGLLGLGVGQFIDWCNLRMPEYKKIFSKEIRIYLKNLKPNYILMFLTSAIYIALLYMNGNSIVLYKFLLLTPMLISAFVIDYRHQIIPNRLNLTIFEVGLGFTFIEGMQNINVAINMLLGAVVGAGIFMLITIIGRYIAGKEAMGLGDVKFMGALGLYFGWVNMIIISLISFLIGAIICIGILITKGKKAAEYIAFGPFIVLATFIVIFVPFPILFNILLKVFTLGMYR